MFVGIAMEMLKRDSINISDVELQGGLKELVKYIDGNGFDLLPIEDIKLLFKHDMIDINDNIGLSCALDGAEAFILARVPEFDNRFCLICTDCYLDRNIHLGHSSGKLLIGMDSKHYDLVKRLKEE